MACLLLLPLTAHAQYGYGSGGSYNAAVYSGGTATIPYYDGTTPSYHYEMQDGGTYGFDQATAYFSPTATQATSSGPITATFTWDNGGNANNLPPQAVVVTETSKARLQIDSGARVTGSCDDGLGQSAAGVAGQIVTVTGTRYSAVSSPGASFTLSSPCSPSATATGSTSSAEVFVYYSATASPVTINLGGVTTVNGALEVLTGQQITATLNTPYSVDSSTYTWSATGDVFKTYNETAPSHQLVLLSDDPSYTNQASFSFYDKKAETITITCNATLIAPDGTRLQVTAQSPQITVVKPTVTRWDVAQGYVQYDPNYASEQNGSLQTYGLYGDLSGPNNASTNGMICSNVTVSVPAPFSGEGQCTFTQLVNPDHLGYTDKNSTPLLPNNGILGLDTAFEYGSPWNVTAAGSDIDSPSIIVGAAGGPQQNPPGYTQIGVTDAFTTYVMYRPPANGSNGTVWVPLQKFSWSWGMTLNWQPSQWSISASYPATSGSAPTYTTVSTNDPPQWTVIQHT